MFRQVITPRARCSMAMALQSRAVSSQSRPSLHFRPWIYLVKLLTKPCVVALPRLLARQINVYAMKKVRRVEQILRHYNNFYSERAIQNLASSFQRSNWYRDRRRPFYILFGGACFAWHDDRLSENDFKQCQDDLEGIDFFANSTDTVPDVFNTWETVINRDHLKAWRKQLGNTHLYEYKLFCRFFDISAKDFFQVQWDLDYRQKWDKLALKLNLVSRESPNSDVIHWVLRYPYPMYNRDYVYHRRYFFDKDKNLIIIFNKSTEHASVPENTNIVRVSNYYSHMIIRPHFTMEENGFDFIMTYHDDPRTNFPPSCINWMSTTGVPDYVEKLHQATLQLSNTSNIVHLSSPDNQQQNHNPGQYST